MWLCTKYGFYSVVQKAPDEFHVRARCARDLENLRDLIDHLIQEGNDGMVESFRKAPKIIRTVPADYRFRMVLSEKQWIELSFLLVLSIDYPNFKAVIGSKADQRAKYGVYAGFHREMELWQEDPRPASSARAPATGRALCRSRRS